MPEYKCRDCGEYFDEPHRWVEKHGFADGPYEKWSACPHCGSCDYGFSGIVDAELECCDEEVDEAC